MKKAPNQHFDIPGSIHILTDTSDQQFDYVLFKHPGLSLLGVPWNTFWNKCQEFTICGALVAHEDHFFLRDWRKYNDDFDIFRLREWSGGSRFDQSHGYGPYGLIQPVPIDFIPNHFALLDGAFYKTFQNIDNAEWCGAAREWSVKEPTRPRRPNPNLVRFAWSTRQHF